ncbi:MAG: hypothetical protein D3919_06245 [Candidatus Electrothrix sp. AW5]|nr:hypothetical protein [Candidatus Electrothrix gigas]
MNIAFNFFSVIFFFIFLAESSFAKDSFPDIPSLKANNSATDVRHKAIVKPEEKTEHNGYKVIDKDGNVFFIDDIDKPKRAIYMTYIEESDKAGLRKKSSIKSDIYIDKIIFK